MRRIEKISITNLFEMFNYDISINTSEHITIIHSPNGFGKTAILRLLNDLFSRSSKALRTIPFSKFRVDFSDNTSLWVTKNVEITSKGQKKKTAVPKITFHLIDEHGKEQSHNLHSSDQLTSARHMPLSMIERIMPQIERIGSNRWLNIPSGEILSLEDILERYGDTLPTELGSMRDPDPDWLKEVRCSIPIRFIETQRLLNPLGNMKRNEFGSHSVMIPTVNMYSEELAEAIKTKLAESTALSQSLDSAFPSRLVNPTIKRNNITETELRHKLAALERKRSALMAAGLVDQDSNSAVQVSENDEIDPSTQTVLSVYIEDAEKKLGVFDEIASKIDLLKSIINKRFLYKSMSISRKNGFTFTTSNGVYLEPADLSSGEQHELVLFYELLFKVAPGSFILIDEPELSLHVVWQEHFLKDVQDITELTNTDVLIATHSPDIINSQRNLVVELEGPH